MKINSLTDKGYTLESLGEDIVRKKISDDSFFYGTDNKESPSFVIAAVCDGVGSLPGSHRASNFVASKIKEIVDDKELSESIKNDCFREIEDIIFKINEDDFWKDVNIATTLTLLVLQKNKYMTFNIGDSRTYLIYDENIKQITKDQTNEAGALTQWIGSNNNELFVSISDGVIPEKCKFLLCSDGIYKKISEKEIKDLILSDESDSDILKNIVEIARSRKEYDDITAILISI